MNCIKCGNEITTEMKFCNKCGNEICCEGDKLDDTKLEAEDNNNKSKKTKTELLITVVFMMMFIPVTINAISLRAADLLGIDLGIESIKDFGSAVTLIIIVLIVLNYYLSKKEREE